MSKPEILAKEHNEKSANPQSLAEFICNHLKSNAVAMDMRFEPVAKDTDSATIRLSAAPSKNHFSQEADVKLDVFLLDPKAQSTTEPTELHAKSS